MKTKCLLSLLLLLLFNVIGGAAQNAKTDKPKRTVMLGQIVKDSFTGVRLKAHVTLMRQDSTVVDTITCHGWQGNYFARFEVEAKPAKYIVKAECEGYATNCQDYEIKRVARNRGFKMPDLNLKKLADSDIYKEVDLDGVVVTGTKVKFTYRGDTLVYNASAFNARRPCAPVAWSRDQEQWRHLCEWQEDRLPHAQRQGLLQGQQQDYARQSASLYGSGP